MIQEIIDFFTGIPKASWRDVVLCSFLIPLVFYLITKLRIWLVYCACPNQSMFQGFNLGKWNRLNCKTSIFISKKWFNGSYSKNIFIFDPIWQNYFCLRDSND